MATLALFQASSPSRIYMSQSLQETTRIHYQIPDYGP